MTEFVEVDFPELPQATVIQGQLDALDAQEETLLKEFNNKVEQIQRKKAELLALPNIGE